VKIFAPTFIARERAAWLVQHVLPHERVLRGWLVNNFRDQVDVDDVIQECYALMMSMEDVSHIQDVRSYLLTAVRSVVLQGLRRAKVVQIESVGEIGRLDIASEMPSPESNASGIQELRQLEQCVRQLPQRCREVFLMRKMKGLSQRQISEHLGISENTVEKHMVKALKYLGLALAAGEWAISGSGTRRVDSKEAIREKKD
jgi:RNA polymerase sigma-70 factor (ECF subfamily)